MLHVCVSALSAYQKYYTLEKCHWKVSLSTVYRHIAAVTFMLHMLLFSVMIFFNLA